jgi:hypothetical protein
LCATKTSFKLKSEIISVPYLLLFFIQNLTFPCTKTKNFYKLFSKVEIFLIEILVQIIWKGMLYVMSNFFIFLLFPSNNQTKLCKKKKLYTLFYSNYSPSSFHPSLDSKDTRVILFNLLLWTGIQSDKVIETHQLTDVCSAGFFFLLFWLPTL